MIRFSFAGLLILAALASDGQPKDRPSVIVIMADQLRFDVIGELTPNIASLRRDGVSFNRAYCASPICVPSRASFFTGMYPNRHGSIINAWEEEDAEHGIARKGLDNLYTTLESEWDSYHVGKQHFFTEEKIDGPQSKTRWITTSHYSDWVKKNGAVKPGGPKFKAMIPEMVSGQHTHTRTYSSPVTGRYEYGLENFLDHYIGNECVRAIRERDKSKPLMLNAMFLAPHPPFHIPEPYYSMFDEANIELPENVGKWYSRQSPLQLYNLTGFLGTRYSREEWDHIWRKYLGLVKLLDDEVGRILAALKDEGLYDKSVIIFTADHGEMLGSHSLWQKMCMYEESARVPLIIKFPAGLKPSIRNTDVAVSLVDVFPTLLELTGRKIPSQVDGRSLVPMVRNQDRIRPPVFIQYDGNASLGNFQRCVVVGDFKLVVDIFKDEFFIELYDLKRDQQETSNLAFDKQHQGRVRDMLDILARRMEETGDRLRIPSDVYDKFLSAYTKITD